MSGLIVVLMSDIVHLARNAATRLKPSPEQMRMISDTIKSLANEFDRNRADLDRVRN